jgi:hypothetical protein
MGVIQIAVPERKLSLIDVMVGHFVTVGQITLPCQASIYDPLKNHKLLIIIDQ